MGYPAYIYSQALAQVQARALNAENRAEQIKNELYERIAELKEIDRLINRAGIDATREAMKLRGAENILRLKERYDELCTRKSRLLSSVGLTADDLKPKYTCAACSDTGYRNGKLCDCVKAVARELVFSQLCGTMPLEKCTFNSFNLDYYTDSDRTRMESIFNYCKKYANFFSLSSPSLLFMGRTGLGKTHLSLAIASGAIELGYGVIYGSAQNFLSDIEHEHFGRKDSGTLDSLLECDLLIMDDLGSEFSTQFTVSAIYNIINSRLLCSRPTIISTNLSPEQLNDQYGERVLSRIIGSFEKFQFVGRDVRQQIAMKK